jgi:hypothetical protein
MPGEVPHSAGRLGVWRGTGGESVAPDSKRSVNTSRARQNGGPSEATRHPGSAYVPSQPALGL